jgi:IS4 transposase
MKTGDVVFVRSEGILPELIRFFDKGKFNHVVFFISDTQVIEANIDTGVTVNDFRYSDYEVISTDLSPSQLSIIEHLTRKFKGDPYDLAQLLRLLTDIEFGWHWLDQFNDDKEVLCSELVGYYLVALGKADESVINMSPNQLYAYMKK